MKETSRALRFRERNIHWWTVKLRSKEEEREDSCETRNRPRQGETLTGAATHS
ncbi:MAG: hypothetical protein GY696_32085 [Gammaproteobacteria bacterium]|nr:hypothetical protein [Gammaproteobacteria bacterium]